MKKRKLTKILLSLATGIAVAMPLIGEKVEVSAAEEVETMTQLINPIAKYEFKDASNPGKDSMGNYDLTISKGPTSEGTVTVDNGVATFDGTAGLISNPDITENLNSFTLLFEIKTQRNGGWAEPVGFGWDDWTPAGKWGSFVMYPTPNDTCISFATSSARNESGKSNVDGSDGIYWSPNYYDIGETEFHKVALSIDLSGYITAYVDGNPFYNYATPAGYSLAHSNMYFSLGGNGTWNEISRNMWKGQLSNVTFYNVAMTSDEIANYNSTGTLVREVEKENTDSIVPVALYEFNDENNPGKDSMGNYHLNKSGDGTIAVENSIATFNGTAGLIGSNDISDELESFTLLFDIKTNVPSDWAEPIGFGWDNWTPTKWNTFHLAANTTDLRFGSYGNMSVTQNQWWGDVVGTLGTASHKVALSMNKNGNTVVYFDGSAVQTYVTPTDYSLKNETMHFAIGGNGSWGSVGRVMWSGSMDTVAIYDFAMTAQQVQAYNTNGKLQINNLTSETYIKSITEAAFSGEETSATLYDNMTTSQMFSLVNPANAVATMSDETTKQLPLIWTSVIKENDSYYAVGSTMVVGQSTPTMVSKAIIKHELTVVDYASTCMDGVATYMNLAYRYTNNEGTYSNVEFRLQVGYDSLISTKATEYGASEYGIEVSTTAKTQKYAYTQATRLDSTQNINYEIISLGDAINNIDRSTVVFTVKAYMVVDGVTYYSNVVKTYSVVDMVAAYYADEATKDAVSGLYELYAANGYYNA